METLSQLYMKIKNVVPQLTNAIVIQEQMHVRKHNFFFFSKYTMNIYIHLCKLSRIPANFLVYAHHAHLK